MTLLTNKYIQKSAIICTIVACNSVIRNAITRNTAILNMVNNSMLKNNMAMRAIFLGLLLLLSATTSATVVTSIRPLAFIASAITDGVTSTEIMVPDGSSPHSYALRPSDLKLLRSAQLVIWVGPELEGFLGRSLRQVKTERLLTLAEVPAIREMLQCHGQEASTQKEGQQDADGDHHGKCDMHIWLSPEIAKVIASAIYNRLVTLFPQNRAILTANLQKFEKKVEQVKVNIARLLQPVKGRGYFVFHNAYGYFEKQFQLKGMGYFTLNPEIQVGAQKLNQIRTQLLQNKVSCIFTEPQFRPAIIRAVTQGFRIHTGTLDPLGIGINTGEESYVQFLNRLARQFFNCLQKD